MRVIQKKAARGSQKWLQRLANLHPSALDRTMQQVGSLDQDEHLAWVSPLRDDDWAEYRDSAFLKKLNLSDLSAALSGFWPVRGPQWDGLAGSESGKVVLVEAKSHIAEIKSTCQAKAKGSLRRINTAFDETKAAIGAPPTANWLVGYYQYANRLAHLHFLRRHGIQATLVFIYFTGDTEMRGPLTQADWEVSLLRARRDLGLPAVVPGVLSTFVNTTSLV